MSSQAPTVPLLGGSTEPAREVPEAAGRAPRPETILQREQASTSTPTVQPVGGAGASPPGFPEALQAPRTAADLLTSPSPARPGSGFDSSVHPPVPPAHPEPASQPVQRLDTLSAAAKPQAGFEPAELPLLGRPAEAQAGFEPPAEAQQRHSGLGAREPVQRSTAGEGPLFEDRPPLDLIEPTATRPLLGDPKAPDLGLPQAKRAAAETSLDPEPVSAPRQVPIQRSSFIERARSWAAGATRAPVEPTRQGAGDPVLFRSAEPSAVAGAPRLQASAQQLEHPASGTFDVPLFRSASPVPEPVSSQMDGGTLYPPAAPNPAGTLQRLPKNPLPEPQQPPQSLPALGSGSWNDTDSRRLAGEAPAPTALGSRPGHPSGPSVQLSRATEAGPGAPTGPLETVAAGLLGALAGRPAGRPDSAAAGMLGALEPAGLTASRMADHTAPATSTLFSEIQTQPLDGGPASMTPAAQLPLVREHPSTGLGTPGSVPPPANHRGDRTVQRSTSSPAGAADGTSPAETPALNLQNRPGESYSPGPLPVARSAYSAPYRPEIQASAPAQGGRPAVQRASTDQDSRDVFVAQAENAAAAAVAAGVATRGSDGALVFRSPEASAPPVARAPSPPPAPRPEPAPIQRTTVSAPAPAAAGEAEPQPQDLDELAMRLYPKLRPYLRKDLWLDRERSGLLADLR